MRYFNYLVRTNSQTYFLSRQSSLSRKQKRQIPTFLIANRSALVLGSSLVLGGWSLVL
jgi:hypothetical protein